MQFKNGILAKEQLDIIIKIVLAYQSKGAFRFYTQAKAPGHKHRHYFRFKRVL